MLIGNSLGHFLKCSRFSGFQMIIAKGAFLIDHDVSCVVSGILFFAFVPLLRSNFVFQLQPSFDDS